MKHDNLWFVSALVGLMVVMLLNVTPYARARFGIKLPFGWRCRSNDAAQCAETCTVRYRYHGIPFSVTKNNGRYYCSSSVNDIGLFLNGLTGMGVGLLGGLVVARCRSGRELNT